MSPLCLTPVHTLTMMPWGVGDSFPGGYSRLGVLLLGTRHRAVGAEQLPLQWFMPVPVRRENTKTAHAGNPLSRGGTVHELQCRCERGPRHGLAPGPAGERAPGEPSALPGPFCSGAAAAPAGGRTDPPGTHPRPRSGPALSAMAAGGGAAEPETDPADTDPAGEMDPPKMDPAGEMDPAVVAEALRLLQIEPSAAGPRSGGAEGALSRNALRKRRRWERVVAARRGKRRQERQRRRARRAPGRGDGAGTAVGSGPAGPAQPPLPRGRVPAALARERLLQARAAGPRLCLDLGVAGGMTEKESGRLASQIRRLYGANRRAARPFWLCLTEFAAGTLIYEQCLRMNDGFARYLMDTTPESYLDLFPLDAIVYLTPDSENGKYFTCFRQGRAASCRIHCCVGLSQCPFPSP
ncbi:tRNA methyltransferase 10 homolog B isoform X2 [Chiroxiphia lanceolata]|uniref:tRNA methyltransferase 10 homolog B isoform X2 n=1 Tax=Chiroxiphia lanceolata TaxID=296741 RepID=UPI0013CEDF2A|nr:tRNA methyltransferase 10 homolog B isoform X2 [Chiroxiphia lanceolata]